MNLDQTLAELYGRVFVGQRGHVEDDRLDYFAPGELDVRRDASVGLNARLVRVRIGEYIFGSFDELFLVSFGESDVD